MLVKDPPVEIFSGLWMLGSDPYPLYLVQGPDAAGLEEAAHDRAERGSDIDLGQTDLHGLDAPWCE